MKNKLGIGGVNVNMRVPHVIPKMGESLEGQLTLTTKSEQEVVKIRIELRENYRYEKDGEEESREFLLGEWISKESFTIQPDEVKEISFELPYEYIRYDDSRKETLKGIFNNNDEHSTYEIKAIADVKSAVLDPTSIRQVRFM